MTQDLPVIRNHSALTINMSFSSPKTGQQVTNILPIKQELKFADDSVPTSDHGELPRLFTNHRDPLKLSGALEKFESFDVTPVIGREFVGVDLSNLLRAPNSDELIRDLAITSTLALENSKL